MRFSPQLRDPSTSAGHRARQTAGSRPATRKVAARTRSYDSRKGRANGPPTNGRGGNGLEEVLKAPPGRSGSVPTLLALLAAATPARKQLLGTRQTLALLDVAEKLGDHIQTKLKNDGYQKSDDPSRFASDLTDDLRNLSKDHHFFMEYNPGRAALITASVSPSKDEVEKADQQLLENDQRINFGFEKLQRLQGNIGYLDLRQFCDAETAGNTALATMNFLAHMDAVIVDLRKNHGGNPNMVQLLCSYFVKGDTEGRTLLNSFERRHDNSIEQYWTLSFVPGKRMYDVDLYVLTSRNTASGAEEFSCNMKNLNRATLVGETTAGAAHPVDYRIIEERFVLSLPTGRPINPISKTNWEGVGIEPHVEVAADSALDTAHKMALEKLRESASDEDQKFQIEWAFTALNARSNPLEIDEDELHKYVGDFGQRRILFKNGKLIYRRSGGEYGLTPITEDLFAIEGVDYARIEFEMDPGGNVTGMIMLYDDGTMTPAEKTSGE